jgi:transposase
MDVAKAELVLGEHGVEAVQTFGNDRRGWKKLLAYLGTREVELVALEASGGYEEPVLDLLHGAGVAVARVNAQSAKRFLQARGPRAKTDRIDARGLAHFAAVMAPRAYVPLATAVRALRDLARQRDEIVVLLAAQRCRLQQQARGPARACTARLIRDLQREARVLERLMAQRLQDDEGLREKARLLGSLGGFRTINTAGLLASLTELGQLKRTEIAALAGVAPISRDSGSQSRQRRIGGGRAGARKPLYLASISLIRKGKPLSAFYARLRARGKPAKVAITACMRKLVVILNAMLRDQRPWQPNLAIA